MSASSVVASALTLCLVAATGAAQIHPAAEVLPQDTPAATGAATDQQETEPSPERVPASSFSSGLTGQDLVVRTVGGVKILASDVYRALDLSSPGVLNDTANELVLMSLVRLAAQDEGIDVPRAELEAEVDRALSEQQARFALEVTTEITLEEFVAQRHGWSPEEFRAQLRHSVLGNMLLDRVVRLSQWRVDRDELQIILVEDESLAQEISDKLKDGASFTVLARNHSSHPSSAEGGFMPLLPAGLDVPLVAGRGSLAVGEVLGPAPITLGDTDYWRFVRLVDRRGAVDSPWSDLREQIEEDLRQTPLAADELALFEAAMAERYGVATPESSP